MSDIDRIDMVATFRRLALEAGEAIMEVYRAGDLDVAAKADDSPVTRADLAADRIISDGLTARFPGLPLVTEEQAETHRAAGPDFLIVDPLDGTKEFVRRRGDFTVNIALVEAGQPTLGVVYAPARDRLFLTLPDGGAVEQTPADGGERAIGVTAPDNRALRIVASKSHRSDELEAYIARYDVADSVAAGSSLKFCLVAAGEADFYPRLGPTMEWDTAAGHAVLAAAGGLVIDRATMRPLAYGKPGFRNGHFLALAPGVELVGD